jgi:glutathione S-transferase
MLRLYDFLPSGNGYKVRLLLHQLAIPFTRVELDITRGETRTAEFLAKNPNGRIPLLELDDGTRLAESNAILWLTHLALDDERRAALAHKRPLGYAALGVMEGHLATREYFVGSRYSIADIALYAYTHVAPEGGFDLAPYPAINTWLARVRAEPRHVPITHA